MTASPDPTPKKLAPPRPVPLPSKSQTTTPASSPPREKPIKVLTTSRLKTPGSKTCAATPSKTKAQAMRPAFGRTGKADDVGNAANQIASLQKQISMLEEDIEQRAEDEIRLQKIQSQLRARLELFQQQNEENVTAAEKVAKPDPSNTNYPLRPEHSCLFLSLT